MTCTLGRSQILNLPDMSGVRPVRGAVSDGVHEKYWRISIVLGDRVPLYRREIFEALLLRTNC